MKNLHSLDELDTVLKPGHWFILFCANPHNTSQTQVCMLRYNGNGIASKMNVLQTSKLSDATFKVTSAKVTDYIPNGYTAKFVKLHSVITKLATPVFGSM